MRNRIKQIVLGTLLLSGWLNKSDAQSGAYKMQPVVLQTRWAKEVNPNNALKEYPRPQMVRHQWQNLNGLWDYAITVKDAAQPTAFDGKIMVPFPIESALSGVGKQLLPMQNLWYKRSINKPVLKTGERVLLHFGAVDWQTTVFVNGKEAGGHTGGYTEFTIDITNSLKSGNNELAVKVYDPSDQGIGPHGKQVLNPANIYYTPSSGIWQTVWLEVVAQNHINSLTVTPDIDKGTLNLKVNATEKAPVTITYNGKTVKGYSNTDLTLPVKNARLWSPDDPYLYDLMVTMGTDKVKSYFGMRKIAIQKDEKGIDRIFLNNKYTYNLGTLDQGFWPDGLYTAPTDEALAFDIKAIKAMGFNTIRKHIKVEPARWYYHADKIGVLVWQDMVNPNQQLPKGSKQAFEQQCKETLEQLHNYPSIITWVLFNEKWGQYDQERLTKWLKVSDPSRIINGHSGEYLYVNDKLRSPSPNAYVNADMTDVHSYPNPMISEKQPGKAQVCGEFGGVGVSIPGHQWNDLQGWGYIQVQPKELVAKFTVMTKRLKALEAEGLSGSIYTQPFDVEGEENGLLTYDREIIKMPVEQIRQINSELVTQTKGFVLDPKFRIAQNTDINDNDERYPELLKAFENGKRDSAFLRRLTLMALRKKDEDQVRTLSSAYVKGLKSLYTVQNLKLLQEITRSSRDTGFAIFSKNPEKTDAILGVNTAKNIVLNIIFKEEIQDYVKTVNDNPDWDAIGKKVITKYGPFGEAIYLKAKATHYVNQKNDLRYFPALIEWITKYGSDISDLALNNYAMEIFERSNKKEELEAAAQWQRAMIDKELELYAAGKLDGGYWSAASFLSGNIDTYANLLYKLGKKEEAMKWEKKALEVEYNKDFTETLKKMERDEKTWPENK